MNPPRVSVITPTYNRANLLSQAIESVLSQDFDDLELIVVDDGSTDNTADSVREIQNRDARVCYRKLPQNRGVGFARDMGLRQARGEYIAWIDSDDLWLPCKLRMQVDVLNAHPEIEILFGDFWNINHINGNRERSFVQDESTIRLLETYFAGNGLYRVLGGLEKALQVEVFLHLQTTLWRAKVIEKTGGFDIALRSAEDFEFFWRGALLGVNFAYIDHALVERHKYPSSLTVDIAASWTNKLEALHRCRRWCELTGRNDLLKDIAVAEERARRNLIRVYGLERQRSQALRVYLGGLKSGLSWKAFLSLVVSLTGPNAVLTFDSWSARVGKHARTA